MTLQSIKAQFKPGDNWHCIREEKRPNMPHCIDRNEVRTVKSTGGKYLTWTLPDGRNYESPWPKASEILDARDGFVKFHYFDGGVIITFTKES